MHELGIAQSVIQAVEAELASHPGAVPSKVAVRLGDLSGVDPDALSFGFEVLVKDSRWPGLALEIERTAQDELELAYLELEDT